MRVKSLSVANLRAIESAEFAFEPGFNMIVGVNGVGKSSVLDALRTCFSRILPSITDSRNKPMAFVETDIRKGTPFLEIGVSIGLGGGEFRFTRHERREAFAADLPENVDELRRKILETERPRDRKRTLLRELESSQSAGDSDSFDKTLEERRKLAAASSTAPNCIFFSTNRAVASYAVGAKAKAAGGKAAAYAEALTPRPMYLRYFADWMKAQLALSSELDVAAQHLRVLQRAVAQFLPEYDNLRVEGDDEPRLVLDRKGVALEVTQLSDGERGALGLVLDLARRLSIANPSVDDPLAKAEAVILIDEIDLHLHPKWQRRIVGNLTATFPRCQFIATTHSPQVIGEVEHGRVQIIANGRVYSPSRSFGMDSSSVLEEIMDADSRTAEVQTLLAALSAAIGKQEFERARNLLSELVHHVGVGDPEVTRLTTLLDFMEGND